MNKLEQRLVGHEHTNEGSMTSKVYYYHGWQNVEEIKHHHPGSKIVYNPYGYSGEEIEVNSKSIKPVAIITVED